MKFRILEEMGRFFPQKSLDPFCEWKYIMKHNLMSSGAWGFESLQLAKIFLDKYSVEENIKIHKYP